MIKRIQLGFAIMLAITFFAFGSIAFAQTDAANSLQATSETAISADYEVSVQPVKFFDKVKLFFTFNAEKKADLLSDFSKRNFVLATQNFEQGNTAQAEVLLQKSEMDMARANIAATKIIQPEKREQAMNRMSSETSMRAAVLTEVQSRLENPVAQEALGRAITRQQVAVDVSASQNAGTRVNSGTALGGGIGISAVNPACTPTTTPYIKVLSPNGGEEYVVGEQITVTWEKCNPGSGSQVMIILKSTQTNFGAEIATVPNTGSASITLPSVLGGGQASVISGSYYKIRLEVGGNAMGAQVPYADESDNLFKIGEASSENESVCGLNVQANQSVSFPLTITGQISLGNVANSVSCPLGLFEGQVGTVQALSSSGGNLNNSWAALMIYDPNFDYQPGTYSFSGTLNMNGSVSSGQNVILRFTREDPSGAPPVSFDIPVTVQ